MDWRSSRGSTRTMRATYPFLFREEGTWFSRLAFKLLVYIHGTVRVAYACE